MDDREKYERAQQQVAAMTGFYFHLTAFVLVMALLLFINATASSAWWVQWPFLGWGTFVLGHAVIVFGNVPGFISNWQRRKIKELADKM
jgi:hypothetical protein